MSLCFAAQSGNGDDLAFAGPPRSLLDSPHFGTSLISVHLGHVDVEQYDGWRGEGLEHLDRSVSIFRFAHFDGLSRNQG